MRFHENGCAAMCATSAHAKADKALDSLRETLRKVRKSVDIGHRSMTKAWNSPLSLYGHREEVQAAERGVPSWALQNASSACHLAETAAEQVSLSECYEAQLCIPLSRLLGNEKSEALNMVLVDPVHTLIRYMEATAQCLSLNLPVLEKTKAAFSKPGSQLDPAAWITVEVHESSLLPLSCLIEAEEPEKDSSEEIVVRDVLEDSHISGLRLVFYGLLGYPVNFDGVGRSTPDLQESYRPPTLPKSP